MNLIEKWYINRIIKQQLRSDTMFGISLARIGAVGTMLGVISALFLDISAGTITAEKGAAYWIAFSLALSQLGIRNAVGRTIAGNPMAQTTVDTKPPVPLA